MPSNDPELPPAYYLPLGDGRFAPTAATTSPWDQAAQHGGPPTALLAVCLDDEFGRSGIGLTEGTLADAAGRCGTVTQPLLVARR
jgi:hypothetical protein